MRIKAEDTMAMIVDYAGKLVRSDVSGRNWRKCIDSHQGLRTLDIPMMITQQYTQRDWETLYSLFTRQRVRMNILTKGIPAAGRTRRSPRK